MSDFRKKRIGDILLQENLISPQNLDMAIALQETSNKRLGEILVEEGYISESDLLRALEIHTGIPRINLYAFATREGAKLLPEYLARKHMVFPISSNGKMLTIAISDPLNVFVVDDIKLITGYDVQLVMAPKDQIQGAIDKYYDSKTPYVNNHKDKMAKTINPSEAKAAGKLSSAELLDMLIEQAVHKGASDIHIEPQRDNFHIRFRIDGVLVEIATLSMDLLAPMIQKIKVSANLDITNKRLPQDGQFIFTVDRKRIDIRVSTMPTINGEKAVLRVLNDNLVLELNELGFNTNQLTDIEKMVKYPSGIILVTGPIGSGKTTTLYSMIKLINTPSKNIVTLEEPVEYIIPGVNQIQIDPKVGLSFSQGIRSILRQDPDIIMIGEIRDPDTTKMAIRAALSGHLVLSTLHTHRAAGAISRLLDMGVEPFLLSSCIIGVISQALVRRICHHCKAAYEPSLEEREFLGLMDSPTLWKGEGCELCSYTGYKGRIAVSEILRIQEDYRDLIMMKAAPGEIERFSRQRGFVTLRDNALELVKKGITTTEELLRTVLYDA